MAMETRQLARFARLAAWRKPTRYWTGHLDSVCGMSLVGIHVLRYFRMEHSIRKRSLRTAVDVLLFVVGVVYECRSELREVGARVTWRSIRTLYVTFKDGK